MSVAVVGEMLTWEQSKERYPFIGSNWWLDVFCSCGELITDETNNQALIHASVLDQEVRKRYPKQVDRLSPDLAFVRSPEWMRDFAAHMGCSYRDALKWLKNAGMDTRPWVYYIRNARTGRIKIGHSQDVWRRMEQLRCATDDPFELLAYELETGQMESKRHHQFESARQYREWFDPVPELLAYIQELHALNEKFPTFAQSYEAFGRFMAQPTEEPS